MLGPTGSLPWLQNAGVRRGRGGGGGRPEAGRAQRVEGEAAREADICAQTDRVSLIGSFLLSL